MHINWYFMKRIFWMKSLFLFGILPVVAKDESKKEPVGQQGQIVWERGNSNGFPDLKFFGGKFYCCFREVRDEGKNLEEKGEGKIRILSSKDGKNWSSVQLFSDGGNDLRNPRLTVTHDQKFLIHFIVHKPAKSPGKEINANQEKWVRFSYSSDGSTWTPFENCILLVGGRMKMAKGPQSPMTWYKKRGYTIRGRDIYVSDDGMHFEWFCQAKKGSSDSTIRFLKDLKKVL